MQYPSDELPGTTDTSPGKTAGVLLSKIAKKLTYPNKIDKIGNKQELVTKMYYFIKINLEIKK